jgi:cyanophycin synthetase
MWKVMSNPTFNQQNGRNVNVYVWEYVRAATELNLNVKYITPKSEKIEKYIEVSNSNQKIRISMAMLPLNDSVSSLFAKKKQMTNYLLSEAGISVPQQYSVESFEELMTLNIELPVVVKPSSLSGGKGVTANVSDVESLKTAFDIAKSLSDKEVLVETMLMGMDHRVLVLNGEVLAAIIKHPPVVKGDGKSSIEQLVETENNSENRISRKVSSIKLDNDSLNCIKSQGFTNYKDIPEEGKVIKIHTVGNLSRGATTENVTDRIHEDFKKIAIDSANALNLKIAGVDIIAEDITAPASEQNNGVIEVNAHPGTRLHINPTVGEPVDVAKLILQKIFTLI